MTGQASPVSVMDAAAQHERGVFDAMCITLRTQIESGAFEHEYGRSAPLALHAAGFTATDIIERLDDVCAAVLNIPRDSGPPETFQSIGSAALSVVAGLERARAKP